MSKRTHFIGRQYDCHIEDRLGQFDKVEALSDINERKFCELQFKNQATQNILNGAKVYRTYHPGYLRRNKNKHLWPESIVNALVSIINVL